MCLPTHACVIAHNSGNSVHHLSKQEFKDKLFNTLRSKQGLILKLYLFMIKYDKGKFPWKSMLKLCTKK